MYFLVNFPLRLHLYVFITNYKFMMYDHFSGINRIFSRGGGGGEQLCYFFFFPQNFGVSFPDME